MESSSWTIISWKGKSISMRRDIFATGIAVAVGRLGGLLIPIAMAATYGVTRETDVFFLVWGIVLAFIMIASHLFESVLVPYFARSSENGTSVEALVFGLSKSTLVPLCGFVFACAWMVGPLLSVLSGWNAEDIAFASHIFWLMIPVPICATIASISIGALNADGKFRLGAISPLCRTLPPAIFLLVTRGNTSISGLAVANVVGEFLRAVVAVIGYRRAGYRFMASGPKGIFSVPIYRIAGIQIVGFTGICLFPIFNHMQVSSLEAGEVSVLAYAQHLRNIPQLLLMTAFGTVLLTDWSSLRSDVQSFKVVGRDLVNAVVWTVCCTGLMLAVSVPCAQLLIASDWISRSTGWSLISLFVLLAISLPFDVVGYLAARFLIVNESHRTYAMLAYLRLIVLVVSNYLLLRSFGLLGVGCSVILANAVYAGSVIGVLLLHRHQMQVQDVCVSDGATITAGKSLC